MIVLLSYLIRGCINVVLVPTHIIPFKLWSRPHVQKITCSSSKNKLCNCRVHTILKVRHTTVLWHIDDVVSALKPVVALIMNTFTGALFDTLFIKPNLS